MNRKHLDCETRYYNNSNNSIKLVMIIMTMIIIINSIYNSEYK
jgi:hypothetical protein